MTQAYMYGKYECYSGTTIIILNKMVVPEAGKFHWSERLHDNIFYGGTYMWVLNMAVASCDLYSIQICEAAHICFENL
jgi:hypothetical protein